MLTAGPVQLVAVIKSSKFKSCSFFFQFGKYAVLADWAPRRCLSGENLAVASVISLRLTKLSADFTNGLPVPPN